MSHNPSQIIGSPISTAFGCSRASWFISPRVILEAMPEEWQQRFVDIIDELHVELPYEEDEHMPNLGVFATDDNGENPVIPENYLNNYRHPDQKWLHDLRSKPPVK